jgi:hypothetical protein
MLQISMLTDEALLDQLQCAAFDYFLQTVNPLNGLVADTSRYNSPVSIAVVGFALASYPVAVERGWIERADAKEMLAYQHSGFSLDAGVCALRHTTAQPWSGCCATVRGHLLPWIGCAKGAPPWCTAAPNRTANLRVTSEASRWTS